MNLQGIYRVRGDSVDTGSLSASARKLDLTPAAASAALKRLKSELGVQLFVRSTRNLRLTEHGVRFLEDCLQTLQKVAQQVALGDPLLRDVLKFASSSDLDRNRLL